MSKIKRTELLMVRKNLENFQKCNPHALCSVIFDVEGDSIAFRAWTGNPKIPVNRCGLVSELGDCVTECLIWLSTLPMKCELITFKKGGLR